MLELKENSKIRNKKNLNKQNNFDIVNKIKGKMICLNLTTLKKLK